MAAPDFKKLHKDWKKAKSDAKLFYDEWVRLNTDLSSAHEDVKFDGPKFPKFKLDLGPSLDKIRKQKDVEKNKIKADKAVTQYKKDIASLVTDVSKVEAGKDQKKVKMRSDLVKVLKKLMTVRDDIEDALKTL